MRNDPSVFIGRDEIAVELGDIEVPDGSLLENDGVIFSA